MFSSPADISLMRVRQPAVPVAVSFAAGIVLDRFVGRFTWWSWVFASVVCAAVAVWGAKERRLKIVAATLCGCWLCLGGIRHHAFWSLSSVDDISRFVSEESRLVRLRGTIAEPPMLRVKSETPFRSAFPATDTTILTLRSESLKDGPRFVPVRGQVQVRVSGRVSKLRVADAVEVFGWASKPSPPANPGDYDFGNYLKHDRIECILRVGDPAAVTRISQDAEGSLSRRVDEFRMRGERVLNASLHPRNAQVARALLMGSRSSLPEDLRTAFAESGMMHVLALSGLHVGILAGLVWLICRLLNVSATKATLLMLLAVLGLAVISGGRPPIVRAAVLLAIAGLGRLADKQSHPHNILAIAALVILGWNPTNLFDVGTQLSFLAVMGILVAARWFPAPRRPKLAPDESELENRLVQFAKRLWGVLWKSWAVMLGIWLLTGPLIAAEFHLISPIGFLLNIVLIPLVVGLLWWGYITLLLGWIMPAAAAVFAVPLDWGLTLFLHLVEWGAGVRLGHLYVAGPPGWWLFGYYSLLAGLYYWGPRISRPRFGGAVAILGWTAWGLGVATVPDAPPGLRCTFLSVGHGSAILVEFPNGKTLLFDAGALDDGERAFRVVRSALWERGITRLDAIAVSHGDLDHVNAIPRLAEEVPVAQVFLAQPLLKSPQAVVPYLVERLVREKIPIRTIGKEDRLAFDPSVRVEVLHPDPRTVYAHSNANSLVVRFTHAGRSLLLMGDVEREGLDDLMASETGSIDIMQAPHHGSRTANTRELSDWANPAVVVVAGGHVPGRMAELKKVYGSSARLLSTSDDGAVTVELSPRGQLLVEPALRR